MLVSFTAATGSCHLLTSGRPSNRDENGDINNDNDHNNDYYVQRTQRRVCARFVGNIAVGSFVHLFDTCRWFVLLRKSSQNISRQQQRYKQCEHQYQSSFIAKTVADRNCGRDRFILDSYAAVSNDLVRSVWKSLFTTSDTDWIVDLSVASPKKAPPKNRFFFFRL
jgi:hypothetical protein